MRAVNNLAVVDAEIEKLRRRNVSNFRFSDSLEDQFEEDTRTERSYRLWLEGLIAIIAFNGCLLLDSRLVKDVMWAVVVKRTLMITPLALIVNAMMRLNPPRWIREGSVALGTTLICFINLYAQGSSTAAKASFGLICALVMALFANVTMRLRFWYATASTVAMGVTSLWFAYHATGLQVSERTIAASLITIGFTITMTAGYSLEREERLSYLLFQQSKMQGEELHRLSGLDKLTGLPNRRAFEEKFEEFWAAGMRTQRPMSAVVVDIDHFKVLNDVYGHLYGDEALRRIAGLLAQGLRTPTDFAARFGGEEFVILLPDTEMDLALGVAERMRKLVEGAGMPVPEQMSDDQMLWTTVSCGVSTCVPSGGLVREKLLKSADRALYKAKGNGRNRVEFRSCEQGSSVTRPAVTARSSSGMKLLSKLRGGRESALRAVAKG